MRSLLGRHETTPSRAPYQSGGRVGFQYLPSVSTPRRHRVSLRVRFSETDAMGVANNGVYLAWLEIARIEYLRALGHSYREVHDGGIDLVVAEASVRYLEPAALR